MQEKDTLSFLVTIKDRVSASGGDSENDNLVEVPIRVIVLDENDNAPEFQNVSVPVGLDKSIHFSFQAASAGGWCEVFALHVEVPDSIVVCIEYSFDYTHTPPPPYPTRTYTYNTRIRVAFIVPQVPYETEVLESTPPGTVVFNSILVTDRDTVGENLNVSCTSGMQTPSTMAPSFDPCAK